MATELFLARGFDAVTLDAIAAAAKVSKMTVFNYFPRKEDLMLDRQDDLKLLAIQLAGPKPDGLARLAAGMIVLTVRTARQEAVRVFERGGSSKKAHALFFGLIDQGFAAVQHMTAAGFRTIAG